MPCPRRTCSRRTPSTSPARWRLSPSRWHATRRGRSSRGGWSRRCGRRSRRPGSRPKASSGGPMLLSDRAFLRVFAVLGGGYVLLIVQMLLADLFYTSPVQLLKALGTPEIRYAVWLTLLTSSISALLWILVAIPIGYLLSRYDFPGKKLVNAILDIPVVLPPLVVGLSLLIL